MIQDTPNTQDENEEAPLFVTDLNEFVPVLEDWHQRQVAIVSHLQMIPEGQEIQIEDEAPLVLQGDSLRAFQIGIAMALHYLGQLPFVSSQEEDSPSPH